MASGKEKKRKKLNLKIKYSSYIILMPRRINIPLVTEVLI